MPLEMHVSIMPDWPREVMPFSWIEAYTPNAKFLICWHVFFPPCLK